MAKEPEKLVAVDIFSIVSAYGLQSGAMGRGGREVIEVLQKAATEPGVELLFLLNYDDFSRGTSIVSDVRLLEEVFGSVESEGMLNETMLTERFWNAVCRQGLPHEKVLVVTGSSMTADRARAVGHFKEGSICLAGGNEPENSLRQLRDFAHGPVTA